METELTTDDTGKKFATVQISENKLVKFRELGGGDFRVVRKLTGSDVQMITDNLALYAMVEINGEKLVPVSNEMHLQARAIKLSLSEYAKLPEEYDKAFNPFQEVSGPNA